MKKVNVNKDIFDALEFMEHISPTGLRNLVMKKMSGFIFSEEGKYFALNELSLEDCLDIYKYGYELEKSPHEKLLFRWTKANTMSSNSCFFYREGILDALNDLGIKIKGING